MKKIFVLFVVFTLLFAALSSCGKESEYKKWEAELDLPVQQMNTDAGKMATIAQKVDRIWQSNNYSYYASKADNEFNNLVEQKESLSTSLSGIKEKLNRLKGTIPECSAQEKVSATYKLELADNVLAAFVECHVNMAFISLPSQKFLTDFNKSKTEFDSEYKENTGITRIEPINGGALMENNNNNGNDRKSIIIFVTIVVIGVLILFGLISSGNSSSNYEYNRNDKYYRNNDTNNDGKIDGNEFHNAVDDWMNDHGY